MSQKSRQQSDGATRAGQFLFSRRKTTRSRSMRGWKWKPSGCRRNYGPTCSRPASRTSACTSGLSVRKTICYRRQLSRNTCWFGPRVTVDVVCMSAGVAGFEAKRLDPSAVQAEGGRHPCQHVCQIKCPNPRLEHAASAASSNGAHDLCSLEGITPGLVFLDHLENATARYGAFGRRGYAVATCQTTDDQEVSSQARSTPLLVQGFVHGCL